MNNTKKLVIVLGLGIVAFAILWIAAKMITDRSYTKQLPALPDFTNVTSHLREQITTADRNARRKPNGVQLGELGMVYNASAYYDQAIQCYQLAAKREPEQRIWNYYTGYIKMELGECQDAIPFFDKVIQTNPKAFMALYYKGVAWQSINAMDSAEKILSNVATMNNRNFQIKKSSRNSFFPIPIYAKFHLANLYQNTNRHEMAEKQLKEIIAIQLNFGPAYRQLGGLYATKGDSVWSKFYSARASDLVPYAAPADTLIDKLTKISRSEEILMKQIDLAIRSTNSQWADDLLVGGLKYFSDNKYFVSKAIKQFLNTGMYENALGLVDRHIRFFADDYNEMITLGSQFADAGLIPQAKRYVIKAQSITNQKADNLSALALMMFEKLRMTEESLSLMNELLEKNPDDLPVLINAAYLFHETNDQQKSSQLMAKLNQKAAAHPKVIALRGIIAEQNGKLAEAILLFEQSFKTDPRDRYIIDHLGMIYLRDKMWSKAIDHYRKALAIYPNNATIQENLGGLLVACPEASLRNVKEGVEYSERAFINYEYTVSIRISAGRTVSIGYDQLGERSKAVYFITNTLEFARKVHVSKDYLKNLEDLAKEFSVPK